MQAHEELDGQAIKTAQYLWRRASITMIQLVQDMENIGVHKQIANRLLEPFLWMTTIITATDFANFFNQRCHPDAQPEIRQIAEMMRCEYLTHEPEQRFYHLPFIQPDEEPGVYPDPIPVMKLSTARCARVSYLTHDGKRSVEEDLALHDRLLRSGHWSPFEHVAHGELSPTDGDGSSSFPAGGNFDGWRQYRKAVEK